MFPFLNCAACPIEGQTIQECPGCEVTCLDLIIPSVCPLACFPGCACPPGQVVHEEKCIDPDDCPDLSGLGECI